MTGGISSYNGTTGPYRAPSTSGKGSASGPGSAGGVGSGGSAGSFGSTAMGSATGSFGDMLDMNDITFNLATANISWDGVGLYAIDESDIYSFTDDDPFHTTEYKPHGSSRQENVDAPFTDKGYWENVREDIASK